MKLFKKQEMKYKMEKKHKMEKMVNKNKNKKKVKMVNKKNMNNKKKNKNNKEESRLCNNVPYKMMLEVKIVMHKIKNKFIKYLEICYKI